VVVDSSCLAVTKTTTHLCFYINGVNDGLSILDEDDCQGPERVAGAGECANLQLALVEQMFMARSMERCSF